MSISSMVSLGVSRRAETDATLETLAAPMGVRGVLPGEGETKKTIASALDIVAAFIPSEVIAAYIAGLGLFGPDTDTGKWALFAAAIVLIFLFTAVNQASKSKSAGVAFDAALFLALCAFAIVAFVAWSAALPQTPFLVFTPKATQIGAVAAIVLAGLLPKAAPLFGITPPKKTDGS